MQSLGTPDDPIPCLFVVAGLFRLPWTKGLWKLSGAFWSLGRSWPEGCDIPSHLPTIQGNVRSGRGLAG
jgi:hypothetical protein